MASNSYRGVRISEANVVHLRAIVGDVIEALSQLDMARESGGVVSDEVMSRLRGLLAEPPHAAQGGCC